MAPDDLRAKEVLFIDVLQRKQRAVPLWRFWRTAVLSSRRCLEYLLGEIPMLGRRITADIGWREQRGHENPGSSRTRSDPIVSIECDICSPGYPSQPTLFDPARKALGRGDAVEFESARHVVHPNHVSRCSSTRTSWARPWGSRKTLCSIGDTWQKVRISAYRITGRSRGVYCSVVANSQE